MSWLPEVVNPNDQWLQDPEKLDWVMEQWLPDPAQPATTRGSSMQLTGIWHTRTQALARAVLNNDKPLAVQLARLYWAGDPARAAGR